MILTYLNQVLNSKFSLTFPSKTDLSITRWSLRFVVTCNFSFLENLHGKDIGLTAAQVSDRLASLAANNSISTKLFKNKPLYWSKQDQHQILNASQLKELENTIKGLREKDADLKKQVCPLNFLAHLMLVLRPKEDQ